MALWMFLARRTLMALVTMWIAVTVVFSIVHLIPGDPVALILDEHFSRESYEALETRLGLDRPLWEQYVSYLGSVVRGEWGMSFRTHRDVLTDILIQFPHTVRLTAAGITLAALIGIPAGVISAVYRNRWFDHFSMFIALIGVCTPSFWLGVMLMLFLSLHLGWFPTIGSGAGGWGSTLMHLALPALTIGARSAALIARMSRSAMLDVLGQDYIRTARAKGVGEGRVLYRHALRNAMIPVITILGLDLGSMLAGTTVIEIVFSRPGVGHMLIDAVLARDYPQIQGTLLFYVAIIVIVNVLVDFMYSVIDPRIELS